MSQIMAALLYFEEKIHTKKLLRADAIPLLFPRLLYQILEHLGYPSEPQLERRRLCREIFTLNKWTSMTAYDVEPGAPVGPEHPEEPQPVEIPTDMRAPALAVPSTRPVPEVASSTLLPHQGLHQFHQLYQLHPSLIHLSLVLPYLF